MRSSQAETGMKLDSVSFDRFWSTQSLDGSSPLIDLRTVSLITPSALVQLTAILHAFASNGRKATLHLDGSPVRSYMDRVRFLEAIESVANIQPQEVSLLSGLYGRSRGSNPMLVEVTVVDSGAALPKVLDQIVWTLRHKLKYGKFEAFDIATAVSEICQNTFDHNQGTCGFLAMQAYGKGRNRFLEIGVSDNGAGLRATLRRNPKNSGITSDLQSIQAAIRLGTSEHDDPTRGTGLHHLMEIAYRHGGMVQIWSGRAKARFRMDRKQGWGFQVPEMTGVHLALVLSSKAKKAG